MSSKEFQVVIGLEVHVQLATISKLFCGDETTFGADQNTQVSELSLGYPGTLPVLNKTAVELAVKAGLACSSEIAGRMLFDRKNYFYPDLPKGYQITQDRSPVCRGGFIPIRLKSGKKKKISLTKIHLEEDAGKSVHDLSRTHSMIDYNRGGMPLIEMVTDPVLSTVEEVGTFLYEVRRMVRYLGIGDGNMEEGSLRCDANISLKRPDQKQLGSKVEIKNLNSIKNVQRALRYEIDRQTSLLSAGKPVVSESRLFDLASGLTRGMRKKETLTDYRYFTDPDLPLTLISSEWKRSIEKQLDFIPWELEEKFVEEYNLPPGDARVLTDEKEIATYYLELVSIGIDPKLASNWVMGPVKSYLNATQVAIDDFPLSSGALGELIHRVASGGINNHSALKIIFPQMIEKPGEPLDALIATLGIVNENKDDELALIIDEVLTEFPKEVELVRAGKSKLIGMFMGKIMKAAGGKADPARLRELLIKKIG